MASTDDFKEEFDIIILGTGLTETIVSAAFSRIGLQVLHIDRNNFYGGRYANFSLEGIETWMKDNECSKSLSAVPAIPDSVKSLLSEGEDLVALPTAAVEAHSIAAQHHLRERTAEEEAAAEERKKKSRFIPSFMPPVIPPEPDTVSDQEKDRGPGEGEENKPVENSEHKTADTYEEMSSDEHKANEADSSDSGISDGAATKGHGDEEQGAETSLNMSETGSSETQSEKVEVESSSTDATDDGRNERSEESSEGKSGETESVRDEKNEASESAGRTESSDTISEGGEKKAESPTEQEFTAGDIRDESRRFCFDLAPKILHCCGDSVELLIQSDVARYCEFRTVSRVLTMLKGELQEVPCSRADVFGSKIVSLIEKRLMMKFLQFAVDYKNHPEEYKDYEDKPFKEFLKFKKLSANIQHFIQHAIAMVSDTATTQEGLAQTLKFLQSLGRYGNTAFLFPLYGTGELPQAYSRMSAVFGGTFCLSMTASHLVLDADRKCTGIISSMGKKIKSKYVIAESSYLPTSHYKVKSDRKLARAIFVTDQSISPSKDQELSLLNHVCTSDPERPVTLLELPPSAAVCPKHFYVVHLSRACSSDEPKTELQEIREELFSSDAALDDGVTQSKPRILWSMYFLFDDLSEVTSTTETPENVLITSGGGNPRVDMDDCVEEARSIFKTVCPDEEFLPKPPNPEDIIQVDDEAAAVTEGPSEFDDQGEEGQEGEKKQDTREEESCDRENGSKEKGGEEEERVES